MLNELSVEECYEAVCDFANAAPISDVAEAVQNVVDWLEVKEAYRDMLNQISATVVANRELKELKGKMAGYRRYTKKLKNTGQILALKKYYKQDRKNRKVKVLEYGEYFKEHHSEEIVKEYPLFFEDNSYFVGQDALQKRLYVKVEIEEVSIPDFSEKNYVPLSEDEVIEVFGEENLRHFLCDLFRLRNCETLPLWIRMIGGTFCGKQNKQGEANRATYESKYFDLFSVRQQEETLKAEGEYLTKKERKLKEAIAELEETNRCEYDI